MGETEYEGNQLTEQVALWSHNQDDPIWTHRLTSDDNVMHLGDKFSINCHLTPRSPQSTKLISFKAINETSKWFAHTLLKIDDGILKTGQSDKSMQIKYPALISIDKAEDIVGFKLGVLPKPYAKWRLSVECYLLIGNALYMLFDGFLFRYKILNDNEVGQVFGLRLLPFLKQQKHELKGSMIFLVGCPARLGAIGGLRGYRRTFLEAGWAANTLKEEASKSGDLWHYETEFYDDAAIGILSVDGVERVPLYVGYNYEEIEDQDS